MKRELTCIVCPMGCKIEVGFRPGGSHEIEYIRGNTCKRGEQYAKEECTHPMRMLATTVSCAEGGVVPVKTSKPIPKEKMFACMEAINQVKAVLPIHVGDVIIPNIMNTDVNIVASGNRER